MNGVILNLKARFFNSSLSAVKIAEKTGSAKHIKLAESLLKIKNGASASKLNRMTSYNGEKIQKSEKYDLLAERLDFVKQKNETRHQISNGNIRGVVPPQVHAMMIHQAMNRRIPEVYSSNESGVRNIRAMINTISQDVIQSNSWDVVDKFDSLSQELNEMMDEKVNIAEIQRKTRAFKEELHLYLLNNM